MVTRRGPAFGRVLVIKLKIMKNIALAIVCALAGNLAIAQSTHHRAPERVRQSFSRNFPDAGDARWTYSGGHWNAAFEDRSSQDRGEMVAHFDPEGRYVDSDVPYAESDVPQPVAETARKRYSQGHFHVTMIDRPSRPDLYEVRGQENGRTRTHYYDERGQERSRH